MAVEIPLRIVCVALAGMLRAGAHGAEGDGGLYRGHEGLHARGVEESVLCGETGGDDAEAGFDEGPVESGGADDWVEKVSLGVGGKREKEGERGAMNLHSKSA